MGEQWKHHQAIIHFYSRDNSHSCCYCRKVLLLFYMWIPGCKSLSQQCLIYCPLSSVSSITPNNLVSLGLPALFKSTLSTQWEEAVFLPAKAPKIMYRRKEEGEKKMVRLVLWSWCWNFLISSRCWDLLWRRWKEVAFFQKQHMLGIAVCLV